MLKPLSSSPNNALFSPLFFIISTLIDIPLLLVTLSGFTLSFDVNIVLQCFLLPLRFYYT